MAAFDTHGVLSVSTGRLMGDIGAVYQVISFLIDRDAYTHELAYYGPKAETVLRNQYPALPGPEDFEHVNGENVHAVRSEWEAKLGAKFGLNDALRGCLADEKNMVDTLQEMAPNTPIIQITK